MPDPLRTPSVRPPAHCRDGRVAAHASLLSGLGPAVLGAVLAALALAIPSAAAAAAPCAPREVLLRRLAEGYGEAPRALGLTANGALLELLVSPGGRSFSILMTRPPSAERSGQVSCLVAAGEGWRSAAPAEAPAGQRGRES